jgi:hypothetical protein
MTLKPALQPPDEVSFVQSALRANAFKGQQQKLPFVSQLAWGRPN